MKKRLDQIVQEKLPHLSRNQISSFVVQGKVAVDGKIVTKPGIQIKDDAKIDVDISEPKYVSRAGFKLEKAVSGLKQYGFKCEDVIESPITGSSGNKEFLGYFNR